MTGRVLVGNLSIAQVLYDFITDEVIPGTGVHPESFWVGVNQVITDLVPTHRHLLTRRDELQDQIDKWHRHRIIGGIGLREYRQFLIDIGYLLPEPEDFTITTAGVDSEITATAGPQLVVPVLNARFALNAVNARWGSLYDALYGTDVISDDDGVDVISTDDDVAAEHTAPAAGYDPVRGAKVIAYVRNFLDHSVALETGSWSDVTGLSIVDGAVQIVVGDGQITQLASPEKFVGYTGDNGAAEWSILLVNNGLHIEICVNPQSPIGASDAAGISDVLMESAVTTIVDFEDSVAAVDADDKVLGYRHWWGLNKGDLTEEVLKGDTTFTRSLNPDRHYHAAGGGAEYTLPGRSLFFVRTTGLAMTNDAIVMADDDAQVSESIQDVLFTSLIAMYGRTSDADSGPFMNGCTGSIYIVMPKMHGPEEVAFTCELFSRVEDVLGLPARTLKIGIMDEERRTTVNLKACIKAAADRVVFINTGFLDRTGDEIHTSMQAGPMVRKDAMKSQPWITAYESHNVATGLATGFSGRAQIGKGMWAMTDLMADMVDQKISQPQAGATTGWVPSPTAATLHAMHYHYVDVFGVHQQMAHTADALDHESVLDQLLTIPLVNHELAWSLDEIHEEVDSNCQSILGYVVRWIDAGVGCSKVPNIHNVALMEDRATLRISSQLLANWLCHGVITKDDVHSSLQRMAVVVDKQNQDDPHYQPMASDPAASKAFQASYDLIASGISQPNGYTEPTLHRWRREYKATS